jgi:PAS domain S-box-containing protein
MTGSSGSHSGGVLYVDPDDEAAAPVVETFRLADMVIERVTDASTARERVGDVDCIVSEQDLPDDTGVGLLATVRETAPDLPFILFTDGSERVASEAITAGVTDYVPRDPAAKQRLALVDAVQRTRTDGAASSFDVTEALKDRAMDEAPVGITIADATRRDRPLIYVNEAFEELTGYSEANSLGRNCNFLQGEDIDPAAVANLSRAMDGGEPVSMEVRNYTKAGEPFWNRLDIAPVREEGEVRYFVGFQMDVTDRVEAERKAKRQAEVARAERETVEALLSRLDGLVTDVTTDLLAADTRDAVEEAVCHGLVDTDEYALAWVGDRDPATDTIRPSTWAGVDAEERAPFAVEMGAIDPSAKALDSGELQVITGADRDERRILSAYGEAAGGELTAVAALPLLYGDVTYGVLVVGFRAGASLSEAERRILSTVGRSTSMALHTLTSQRLLASDAVTELEFSLTGDDPFFVGLSGTLDASVVHVGTVARDDEPTMLFFETDADPEAVTSEMAGRQGLDVTPVTTGDPSLLEFTVESSPLVDLLSERGGRLADVRASGGTGELTVEFPPEAQPRAVVAAIEEGVSGADLTAYREHERPAGSQHDIMARIDERLTDRQAEALRTAIVGGFFEWPRETTGEELAETMDIGRSTFHQHLRAAQRKVFAELYE